VRCVDRSSCYCAATQYKHTYRNETQHYALNCGGIFYLEIDGPSPYSIPKIASVVCDRPYEVTKPTDGSKIFPSPPEWIHDGYYPGGEFTDKKISFLLAKALDGRSRYTVEINRILGSLNVFYNRHFKDTRRMFWYEGDCSKAPKALF
jgi:hypothetical protein